MTTIKKKFEKADARSTRNVYHIIIGTLVIAVVWLGLSLWATHGLLEDCVKVVKVLEMLL